MVDSDFALIDLVSAVNHGGQAGYAHTKMIIGITHVFSCINICRVPRKLFEHEAVRPSAQTFVRGTRQVLMQ